MFSFKKLEVTHSVYRGVHISGGWNRVVLLYTKVSSFQGVEIEGVPMYTEVSSFQGVGIEGFHCIPHFRGVGIEDSSISRPLLY